MHLQDGGTSQKKESPIIPLLYDPWIYYGILWYIMVYYGNL